MLRDKTLGREPAGDLEQLLDANLHCNATLARAVLPAMRKRKSGGLAFVTAPTETAGLSVTCRASLAATAEFAAGLASDVADVGLRVATIAAAFADGDSEASAQKLCEAIWASIADGS
jgi:NADP-dependent 3-hydroxy acid dehydrogenase YdfG